MRSKAGLLGLAMSVVVIMVSTATMSPAKSHAGHHSDKGRSAWAHAAHGPESGGEAGDDSGSKAGTNDGGADAPTGHGGNSATTHPPGNNGTVKVDGPPYDSAPNNEPHPGCVFEIDFYGYDQGDLQASYTFDLQPPSGRGQLAPTGSVFIGEDPAGGGTDLDASTGPIDLSSELDTAGAVANANQGYHIKLTVHAEGSIGSDVKHKVFWVGCQSESAGGAVRGASGAAAGSGSAGAVASGRAAARPGGVRTARAARPVSGSPAFTG